MDEDRKIKTTKTYVTTLLHAYPNPSYDISIIHIDDEHLKEYPGKYQCVPSQSNMRGRLEDVSHGDGNVPGDSDRPCINDAGYERVNNVTSVHYHRHICWERVDMDIKWTDENLVSWFMLVKTLLIIFMAILKETCMNQDKFPLYIRGE